MKSVEKYVFIITNSLTGYILNSLNGSLLVIRRD
ncbi:MAG: hypothetical protein ACI8O8_001558 [Oleiphilaceae bacterium]|jgi:hypothetical protein